MMELRLVPKFLKGLGRSTTVHTRGVDRQLRYKKRQFSFDETPIIDVKAVHRSSSMRFLLPCISAEAVDFERFDDLGIDEYDDGLYRCNSRSTKSYSTCSDIVEDEEEQGEEEEWGYEGCDEKCPCPYTFPVEEEGIDSKAERFIAKFYEQLKLQSRQISDLEDNEMLRRGASY
ncbi:CTP synthase family protein isoform 1 [Hibiscus syriacus]|uniref:CTP synthase family protein isoform 1 n=1 Tax=Hibiscus syriacus TaxID=106335 RepID=A0A6A3AJ16_HIBSY|nr:CTP synthase family protein isoform 1 [Hibiscus syriacus]